MPVEKTIICPPRSRMGSLTPEERTAIKLRSPVGMKYDTPINRESAYEILNQRVEALKAETRRTDQVKSGASSEKSSALKDFLWGTKRRQGMVENHGQANRPDRGQPDREADYPGNSGRYPGRQAQVISIDRAAGKGH